MKKKTILILLIAAAVTALGAGCFLFFTCRRSSPRADLIRQLADGIRTSLGRYDAKGYEVSFRQKYNLESKESFDYGDIEFNVSYEGEGSVKLSYEQDAARESTPRLVDLIASGDGYMTGVQKEKLKYYNKEDHKNDEDDRTDDVEYEMAHEFAVKTDDQDYYAASSTRYTDLADAANSYEDSFYGKIDKQLLMKDASEERITKRISELLFMDAWDYIHAFNEYADQYLREVDFSDAEAVDDLIKKHEITAEEKKGKVVLHFVLDAFKLSPEASAEDRERVPNVYGTLEIEKDTGNVLHFEYDFGQYLLSTLMRSGEGKPYFKAEVLEFIVEGQVLNTTLEDLPLDHEFKEYGEEDKAEFIDAFSTHIIPFYEEEG